MHFHKAFAIFKKTAKDIIKNKRELLFFLMFPAMTYLFYNTMPDGKDYFIVIFFPMNVLFCSLSVMAGTIAEEKEKGTLKSLIFANVKPIEYFAGTASFILIATLVSSATFIPIMNINSAVILKLFLFIALNSICSMILGACVGLIAHNQMSANALTAPVTLVLGLVPMFATLNNILADFSKFLYTARFANFLADFNAKITIADILTYLGNFILCLTIFILVYRRKKLDT